MPVSERTPRIQVVLQRRLDSASAALAHRTFVVNRELLDYCRSLPLVRRDSVSFIGNGTDTTGRFSPERVDPTAVARRRAESGADRHCVVLMVGRKVVDKGYPEFLEAAWRLRNDAPTARPRTVS